MNVFKFKLVRLRETRSEDRTWVKSEFQIEARIMLPLEPDHSFSWHNEH